GARAILIERFAEDATLIGALREEVWSRGRLCSRVRAGKAEPGAKFADYFEFSEPLAKLPSHRILALFRGEKEEVLALELVRDRLLAAPAGARPTMGLDPGYRTGVKVSARPVPAVRGGGSRRPPLQRSS